jgi:hypothetical protein
MRKAALIAGVVQLLYATFTVAPQVFGGGAFSWPGQAAFRTFTFIGCLVLAIFFFGIVTMPAPKVGGAVRIVSVLAAAAVVVENLSSVFSTIRGAAAVASDSALWRFHPLRQFGYVLGLLIPTLATITLVVFLLAVFVKSPRTQDRKQDLEDRTGFLKLASFTVATVFVVALVGTVFSVILAPRPPTVSVAHLLLRFAALASYIAFFFVFGVNQRRDEM